MRALLVVAAVLVACGAEAGPRTGAVPKRTRVQTATKAKPPDAGVVIDYDFGRCGSNVEIRRRGAALSVTRGSVGRYQCGGEQVTGGTNSTRIEPEGLLTEPYGVNWFKYSCASQQDHTTQSVSVGTYLGWMTGDGSVALAAGTVTATGLPCTITAASPCTVVISVAGTIAVDITAPVTFMQLEPSLVPTSHICTTTAAVARWDENSAIPNPLVVSDTRWTVVVDDVGPGSGVTWATFDGTAGKERRIVWQVTGGTGVFGLGAATTPLFVVYAAGGYKSLTWEYDPTVVHDFAFVNDNGTLRVYMDGIEPASTYVTSGGTGLWAAAPANWLLGGPVYGLLGHMKRFRVCKFADARRCGFQFGNPTMVAALGDSMTANGLPTALQGLLGTSYQVTDSGVSGNTVTQMLARYRSDIKGRGYKWLVFLGGTNDIRQDQTGLATYNLAKTIFDEAIADGTSVIILTELPFANAADWSAGRQTQLEDFNSRLAAYGAPATIIDTYALMGEGGDADALAAIYDSGDGLHPNAAGKRYIAGLEEAVIHP